MAFTKIKGDNKGSPSAKSGIETSTEEVNAVPKAAGPSEVKVPRTVFVVYFVCLTFAFYDAVVQNAFELKGCSRLLSNYWTGIFGGVAVSLMQLVASCAVINSPRLRAWPILFLCFCLNALVAVSVTSLLIIPYQYGDEYNPIFYDSTKVRYVGNYNATWLNPTQEPGKKATEWGAGCARLATYGTFAKKPVGDANAIADEITDDSYKFNFINTHLDNVGEEARVGGIKVITTIVKPKLERLNNYPFILTGDFNTEVGKRHTLDLLRIYIYIIEPLLLTASSLTHFYHLPVAVFCCCTTGTPTWYTMNSTLSDSFFSSKSVHVGPLQSYNAFHDTVDCGESIDFIFTSRNGVKVESHGSKFYPNQVSDHNPMYSSMLLSKNPAEAGREEDFKRKFNDCPPQLAVKYF